MKIVNISPIWFHKGEGISEVVINHHLSFTNIGVESILIQTNYHDAIKLPIYNDHLFKIADRDAEKPKSILDLLKLLRREKDAIFFVHGLFQLRMIFTLIFLYLTRQLYVVIPHSSLSSQAFKNGSMIKRILYRYVLSRLLKKSIFVMYLNNEEKVNGIYHARNIEIFPNGVTEKIYFNEVGEYIPKKIKLIYLGRYDIKHKGIDYLLEFTRYLINAHPEVCWELNMYGSDSKSGKAFIIDYIKENELSEYVKVNDAIFGDNKDEVLSHADVFVLTSRYEGMPVAILEAVRNGLPCLLTKETNMLSTLYSADIAEEFFITDFDKTFISLINLSEKKSNIEFRKKCAQLIEYNYSWNVICTKIVNRLLS